MKIAVYISPTAALAAGGNVTGWQVIEVDVSVLTQDDRAIMARYLAERRKDGAPVADLYQESLFNSIEVLHPTPDGLFRAILAREEKRLAAEREQAAYTQRAAEREAAQRQESAERLEREIAEFLADPTKRATSLSPVKLGAYGSPVVPDDHPAAIEARRRYAADEAAKKAAAEARLTAMREFVEASGSELLRARLAEGFEWQALAEQEWFAHNTPPEFGSLHGSENGRGFDEADRNSPSLDEITAWRAVRAEHPSVEIIWYSRAADPDEGEDGLKGSALRLKLTAPTGRKLDVYRVLSTHITPYDTSDDD